MPQTLQKEKEKTMKQPNKNIKKMFFLPVLLGAALLVSGCTQSLIGDNQIPGREGLLMTLTQFETGTNWRNWNTLLEAFYLPDHAEEVKKNFGSDLKKWFRSDQATSALTSGEVGDVRNLCILAMREKHLSPRFEPHFVVYYRVQVESCHKQKNGPVELLAEGQMEWGFETKQNRWVHLRSLG
ncbi:MAG: hypothetical protein HOC91_07190 [Nitrospinaceae bacterium]|jgi:hypothetical protein|nr:hypothetical protein [Nitrospinaceae bacterium]